jgi:hypothetical protein
VAFRGWSILLLAPAAALLAAAVAGEPLLAHWTQAFMGSAAGFLAQFFLPRQELSRHHHGRHRRRHPGALQPV